jgi:hypothetical protein
MLGSIVLHPFVRLTIHANDGSTDVADVSTVSIIEALRSVKNNDAMGGIRVEMLQCVERPHEKDSLSFWWYDDRLALDFFLDGFGSAEVTFEQASHIIEWLAKEWKGVDGRKLLTDKVAKWVK